MCHLIQEAIELYVEALEEEGLSAPEPQSYELVEIPARRGKVKPFCYFLSGPKRRTLCRKYDYGK